MNEFELHIGDDYLEITTPSGMVLQARYPDDEAKREAQQMIINLNNPA